jgi:hypothetical protein
MKADPILQEVWDIKDRLAAEAGYEMRRFVEQLREWEATHAHLFPKVKTGEAPHRSPDESLMLREEPPKRGDE